jgi:hypothetical protein
VPNEYNTIDIMPGREHAAAFSGPILEMVHVPYRGGAPALADEKVSAW